jgi:glycosyltransferase involved in cell wall biosynthesis/2-polyprenyl-3-methyl-5-hydroxy-6-metoxy-1,4-benzoquinol methylase
MTKFYFPPEPIHVRELKTMPQDVRLATPEQNFGCHGIAREINALYADTPSDDVMWQPDVYTEARLLADRNGIKRIVDVGCGNGEKLIHNFPADQFQTVGLDFHGSLELVTSAFPHARWVECDLNSTADLAQFFGELNPNEPVLMILSDVIEHIPDPRLLLAQLRSVLLQNVANRLVLSTPDRVLLDYKSYGAAPDNLAHVREWTHEELAAFCTAAGFQIERCGHTRANQFDAKYSTIYVELRCELPHYLGFLKEQGLLFEDALPSRLMVTAEYAGVSDTSGTGTFVSAQRQAYGQASTLCLFVGRPDSLDPEALKLHQLIAPQLLVDKHDMPLAIEEVALKAATQLLFYFPTIRTIEYVDFQGYGCRLAQAKRADLFPQWVEVVAHCQGVTHYLENANQAWLGAAYLGTAEREKISIENADTVVFPTEFLRKLYRESGIEVADDRIVQLRNPYLAPAADIVPTEAADTIVFYGERSAMNGYELFLGAFAQDAESLRTLGVTRIVVIGHGAPPSEGDAARLDALRASFDIVELTPGRTAAVEQLRSLAHRAICVMPYLGGNHPYALLETSFAGMLPLMVRAGGVPELYPEPFGATLLADPTEISLLSRMTALVKLTAEERQRLRVNFLNAMVAAQTLINSDVKDFSHAPSRARISSGRPYGKASVIVPVYNTDLNLVSDLLFGLNNQSMSPAEVIFVDDGSQAGYASQLETLVQRELRLPYRIISHPENRGLAAARNTALNAANTEYVINLDSDDVPLNDFVRNIVRLLDAEPRCGAAVPYLKSFSEETNFNEFVLTRDTFRPLGDGVALSMRTNYLGHANSGYRTSVVRALGGWDASEKSMWEDWALFLKLVSSGHRIGIIPQADCLYRIRKQSMLRTYKTWPAMRRMARNLAGLPRFDSFRLHALMRESQEDAIELARWRKDGAATTSELTQLREEAVAMRANLTWLHKQVGALRTENQALSAELNQAPVRATRRIVARLRRFPLLFGLLRTAGRGVWKVGRKMRNLVASK